MKAVIRCDATAGGGLGHLGRSVGVAQAAKAAGWEVVFVGSFDLPLARELLEESGADGEVPAPSASEDLAALAADLGADLVHVDHYGLDDGLRMALTAYGIRLANIEDGRFGRRPADLAIEPTPAAFAAPRPEDGTWRLVGGADWVPLRRRLLELRYSARDADEIAIMIGGSDAFGVTDWCLQAVARSGWHGGVTVISTQPRRDDRMRWLEPGANAAEILAGVRLAIVAAGTSMWEAIALDTPVAAVAVTDNQDTNYGCAVGTGAVTGLGRRHAGLDLEAAGQALGAALHAPLHPLSRIPIDGLGGRRIVEAWSRTVAPRIGFAVRPAGEADAALLFEWRNAPEVRAASRSVEPLDWPDHRAWLARAAADPHRRLLIVESDGVPVGTVRFDDLDTEGEVEVSITIAPASRGKGLASRVLEAATADRAHTGSLRRIVAELRSDNPASRGLFERAGFLRIDGPGSEPGFERWAHDITNLDA